MLKKINFKDSDTLYVLGDIVDYGEQPMEILQDMSMRANVIPIVGNHEYSAINILGQLGTELTKDTLGQFGDIVEEVANWQRFGGTPTLRDYGRLSADDRECILEYLAEFSLYEQVTVGGQKYILTHAGLPDGATLENLHTYDLYDFVMAEVDYTKVYFDDAILVTGHTPTLHISEEYRGRVFRGNNHLAIDAGGVFGESFACVCLDTGEEFYLTAKDYTDAEIYTVFMGNDINGDGRFTPKRYRTIEEVWECSVIRQRRSTTFAHFADLLNEHQAVKMYAATVYKGKKSPAMRWCVDANMLIPMPPITNE